MAFERMQVSDLDLQKSAGKPTVKLTKQGALNLSVSLVAEFGLKNMTHCELFYEEGRDNKRSRIQIMFYSNADKNTMRLPIRKVMRKDSSVVSLSMKLANTFRGRGIQLPVKSMQLPFAMDKGNMIIGIPEVLTS